MIQLQYNMDMPKTCFECPLVDDEFYYCHGQKEYHAWEVEDMYRHDLDRPDWCPLVEIKHCSQCNVLSFWWEQCPMSDCPNCKKHNEKAINFIKSIKKSLERLK